MSDNNLFSDNELKEMDRPKSRSKVITLITVGIVILCLPVIIYAATGHKSSNVDNTVSSTDTVGTPPSIPDVNADTQSLADSKAAAETARLNALTASAEASLAAGKAAEAQAEQDAQNLTNSYTSNNSSTTNTPISAPSSSVYAYSSGVGTLTGQYYYRVSFTSNTGTETDLGPASFGTSVDGKQIYVMSIPTSSDSRVNQINIYRTLSNGSMLGPYYLLKTTYGNYSNSFYDNASDSSISYHVPKY